jgi:predicted XRE-type DNA-binding protein
MPTKRKAGDQDMIDGMTVTRGSGNVFADLGLPDSEERTAKAQLAREIAILIETMPQTEAATILGIDRTKVSALLRGKLKDFSTERLFAFLTRLGEDVEIPMCALGGGPTGAPPGPAGWWSWEMVDGSPA